MIEKNGLDQNKLERMRISGHEIAFVDQGSGKINIVLIHGLGASHSVWSKVVDDLSRDHRVVALDLLGFGKSSRTQDLSVDDLVDNLSLLLEQLAVRENVILIGNSLGAIAAARFAARTSSVGVTGLILVGTAFIEGIPKNADPMLLARRASPAPDEVGEYVQRVVHPDNRESVSIMDLAAFRANANDFLSSLSILHSLQQEQGLTNGALKSIRVPVLVVHGDSDRIAPIQPAEMLAKALPDGHLAVMSKTGHWPQIEKTEQFLSLVGNFDEYFFLKKVRKL